MLSKRISLGIVLFLDFKKGQWQDAFHQPTATSMDFPTSLDPLPLIAEPIADAQPAGDAPKPFHFDDLKATSQEALKDARKKLDEVLKEGSEYVKANPGKSMIAALGAGFVLGLILKD